MAFPIAGIAGALGSIGSSLISGLFGNDQQERAIQAQKENTKLTADLQMRNIAKSGDALREQKKAQGISTAFQGGGSAMPSVSSSSSPGMATMDVSGIANAMTQLANINLNEKLSKKAEADTHEAETRADVNEADAQLKNSEKNRVDNETKFLSQQIEMYKDYTNAQIKEMVAHADLFDTQVYSITAKLPSELNALSATILQSYSQRDLNYSKVKECFSNIQLNNSKINEIQHAIANLDADTRKKIEECGLTVGLAREALARANAEQLEVNVKNALGMPYLQNIQKAKDIISLFSDVCSGVGNIANVFEFITPKKK